MIMFSMFFPYNYIIEIICLHKSFVSHPTIKVFVCPPINIHISQTDMNPPLISGHSGHRGTN